MNTEKLVLAIDIGAISGAKVAVFDSNGDKLAGNNIVSYPDDFEDFVTILHDMALLVLEGRNLSVADLGGIGIASAGILASDGRFILFHNRPQYNGCNLVRALEHRFRIPACIANDADAGALAEWSILKVEMLYWVFGAGWGGAWVSKDGHIQFPSLDWDGSESSLHCSNEPGFVLALERDMLRTLFQEVGASWDLFENNLLSDPYLPGDSLQGPGGNPETLRAEVILSGHGRCRLFRTLVGKDEFFKGFLNIRDIDEIANPATAGRTISKLSQSRFGAAVNTDRLYGKILAEATNMLLEQSERDGLTPGVPICLGGKPSYALPYFGPSTQRVLGKNGHMNYLRPSIIDERGGNANLSGAAELARRASRGQSVHALTQGQSLV